MVEETHEEAMARLLAEKRNLEGQIAAQNLLAKSRFALFLIWLNWAALRAFIKISGVRASPSGSILRSIYRRWLSATKLKMFE